MTSPDAQSAGPIDQQISRRTIVTRTLAAGLAVPLAASVTAPGIAAQATPVAPDREAINPGELFSGAVVANGFVYTSGMLGIDPDTRELAGDDIASQTQQVLTNLEATLTAAGSSMDRVVKSTVFLTNLDDFEGFNEVYAQAFTSNPPARSTVEVAGLVLGALVEIEFVAVI